MSKQTIKTLGEHHQFQALRDRISQLAAILTAIEYGSDAEMAYPDVSFALAGCNVLLGGVTEKLELLDALTLMLEPEPEVAHA